jgi:mono/diheme cytochrome c family protein
MIFSVVRRTGSAILLALLALALSGTLRAQDGPTLYKTKCAVCHAADGSGSTSMGKSMGVKDLRSDEVQKQTDAQLNAAITNGMAGGKMPAYKGKLTDDQITELVKFIRTLKK